MRCIHLECARAAVKAPESGAEPSVLPLAQGADVFASYTQPEAFVRRQYIPQSLFNLADAARPTSLSGVHAPQAEIFLWLLEQGGGGERALVDYNGSADASAAISYPAALHARSLAPVAAKAAAATAATVAARHAAIALAESGATAVAARAASAAAMRAGVSAAARAAAGSAAARYVASAVVPALWVSVGLDAARAATGRDVTRLTRAVALLAQIRLLRGGRTANRRLSEAA